MIRKANANDLAFVYELYMHPDINPWLLYEPMDMEEFQPIYEELLKRDVKYIYEYNGEPMGMCKLVPYTYRTSHVVFMGGVGVYPGFSGKGHGAQMLRATIDLCRTAGYKRIELSVSVLNEKAIHLYEKTGFVKEGVLKNFVYFKKENRYGDEILMAMLL